MIYVKHPEHGNKHIPAEEVESHVSAGWVVWPRSADVKAGLVEVSPIVDTPVKRGPGRPKKVTK